MPPELVSIGIFALQQLITHEPEIASAIKELFSKADPTAEDWAALKAKIHAKSYRDYVPLTALPLPAVAPAPALPAEQEQPVKVTVLPTPTPEILAAQKAAIEAYQQMLDAKAKENAAAAMAPNGAESQSRLVSMSDLAQAQRIVPMDKGVPSGTQPQEQS
jgi:hypothetical protein